MKRYPISLLLTLLTFAGITSCSKSSSSPATHGPISFPASSSSYGLMPACTPSIPNIWGMLMAYRVTGTLIIGSVPDPSWEQDAVAVFANSSSLYVPAGTVTLNGQLLDSTSGIGSSSYEFIPYGTDTIDLSTDNKWVVSGSSDVPAITYNYSGAFPEVVGNIPDTIDKTTGITYHFSSANVANADSVVVSLMSDSGSVCHQGSATSNLTFSPSELSNFPRNFGLPSTSHFAVMEVILYKYTIQTYGGKRYAFVKCCYYITNLTIK